MSDSQVAARNPGTGLRRYRNELVALVGPGLGYALWQGIIQTARDGVHHLSDAMVQRVEDGMNALSQAVQDQVVELAQEVGDHMRRIAEDFDDDPDAMDVPMIEDGDAGPPGKSFFNLHHDQEAFRFQRGGDA